MEENVESFEDGLARVTFKDGKAEFVWGEYSGLVPNPDLGESNDVIESIETYLTSALEVNRSYGYDSIAVTPEGPFLSGSTRDAASVSWALNSIYSGEYELSGYLPSMKDLGLDYSSNFDEDGNQIVR